MAITRAGAQELADLLPDGMSCNDARERLLCVLEVLRRLTDRDHVLSNAEIRAVLAAYFGPQVAPSENTVAADIRALASAGYLDLALHVTPSGVWCERERLTPDKVRLLLNAVQSSRWVTYEQSADLQESLYDLVSARQEDDLSSEVLVDQRVRDPAQAATSAQVLETVDTVSRALREQRKIEFTYTYSDFSGKPRPLVGDDGQTLRCETPVAIYFSEGYYYVETYSATPWRHGVSLMRSRADRMADVHVSAEPADGSRAVYDARRSARRRLESEFQMVDGPRRLVFLRVKAYMTNVVFDRFGFDLKFAQFEGQVGDPEASGLTLVDVAQAFTFYRWLSSAGEGIVIGEPPVEMALRSGPWKRRLHDVSRDQLMDDYHALVSGFLAYLDHARAPYVGRC